MRLTSVRGLQAGATLARDVPNPKGGNVPLLRAGSVITDHYRDALLRDGIETIYVDDALGKGIAMPEPLSEETRQEVTRVVTGAFDALAAGGGTATLSEDTQRELGRVASLIATEIAACDDAFLALADLASADQYTLQHSVDVTVLGLLVARRLFNESGRRIDYLGERAFTKVEQALTRLGLGLLLHDIGKLAIPREILHKAGPLTTPEWELIRQHPQFGLEMLSSDLIGPTSKAVVRSHHERWDGSGYPDGRRSTKTHQFARIAAVADVFDAVTSERPYSKRATQAVGVATIVAGTGTSFDPEVVEVFRRVIVPYPPGSQIVLDDGRSGVVVSVPPGQIDRPLVRIGFAADGRAIEPFEIDLAKDRNASLPEVTLPLRRAA
jgi:HD-GYP domain-containing protein (c-di-GMP phosphodiesterase class II)